MLIILLIAIGLCIDTFSISAIGGSLTKKIKFTNTVRVAMIFSLCHISAVLLGSFIGIGLKSFIVAVDHWIAFFLLLIIGTRLIFEKDTNLNTSSDKFTNTHNLFILGIGTSIDALIVGVTFAFVKSNVITNIIIIGIVTFILSFTGYCVGHLVSYLPKKHLRLIGGIALILIGVKILVEHIVS